MKKAITMGLCIGAMLCFGGCQSSNIDSDKKAPEVKQEEEQAEKPEKEAKEQTLEAKIALATSGCKVVKEGEENQQGSLTYKVNKVTITKQRGDWIDMSGPVPETDENGMIIGDDNYIVVNVTVKDTGEFDFWWNSFWLAYFSDDDLNLGPYELVSAGIYYNYSEEERRDRDIYQYNLPENEEVTTDLVYVLSSEEMAPGMHYLLELNPTGLADVGMTEPENYSMVYLETMEGINSESAVKK